MIGMTLDLHAVTVDDVEIGGEPIGSAWITVGPDVVIHAASAFEDTAVKLETIAEIGRKLTELAEARLAALQVAVPV